METPQQSPIKTGITIERGTIAFLFVAVIAAASLYHELFLHSPQAATSATTERPVATSKAPFKNLVAEGEGCSIFRVTLEGREFLCNSKGGIVELNAQAAEKDSNVQASKVIPAPPKESAPAPAPEGLSSGNKPAMQVNLADEIAPTQNLMGQNELPVK